MLLSGHDALPHSQYGQRCERQAGHGAPIGRGLPRVTRRRKLVADCRVLIEMMHHISGGPPQLWNVGTLGFGRYQYHSDSGRTGESHAIGFYPRKGRITIHLMGGTVRHAELLNRLGRYTTSRVCVSVKRLSDIDMPILEQIV